MATALVFQVERLVDFALVDEQRHLTQEGVGEHVVVVDLRNAASERERERAVSEFNTNNAETHSDSHQPRC